MRPVAYVLAAAGSLVLAVFSLLIGWDVARAQAGLETESRWYVTWLQAWPRCLAPLAIAAVIAASWGGLAGHLGWPRAGLTGGTWALLAVLALSFGLAFWAGHHFFGQ
jgi:hypothetical protein